MSYVKLKGGRIQGELSLQGSKNAALPILAASILCRGEVTLTHCPDITDVREMLSMLSCFQVKWNLSNGELQLDTREACITAVPSILSKKTRGGILFLGALLGRFHEARLSYPGGCQIGRRPIDYHCNLIRSMKVHLIEEGETLIGKGRPLGTDILLPYPSVGATENAILAAVCAKGTTTIRNAAKEPEIIELCYFLSKAGAKIFLEGTSCLLIEGVDELHGVEHRLSGDRIAAGTYLAAAAMTGGELTLTETDGVNMEGMLPVFLDAGVSIHSARNTLSIKEVKKILPVFRLVTAPFPAFPTDMQSQMLSLLSMAEGDSSVIETVFESRYAVLPELNHLGANLVLTESGVLVKGKRRFLGAEVNANDLRGGAALLLAGFAAEGETKVHGYEYIARGYEDVCAAFRQLGGEISLVDQTE